MKLSMMWEKGNLMRRNWGQNQKNLSGTQTRSRQIRTACWGKRHRQLPRAGRSAELQITRLQNVIKRSERTGSGCHARENDAGVLRSWCIFDTGAETTPELWNQDNSHAFFQHLRLKNVKKKVLNTESKLLKYYNGVWSQQIAQNWLK